MLNTFVFVNIFHKLYKHSMVNKNKKFTKMTQNGHGKTALRKWHCYTCIFVIFFFSLCRRYFLSITAIKYNFDVIKILNKKKKKFTVNLAHSKHTIYNHFNKKKIIKFLTLKANDSFASLHYGYVSFLLRKNRLRHLVFLWTKCHQMVHAEIAHYLFERHLTDELWFCYSEHTFNGCAWMLYIL